jgi:glycosyltransferase involved in cell wall biosynthesis
MLSIIVAFKGDLKELDQFINSISIQNVNNIELIIATDADDESDIAGVIAKFNLNIYHVRSNGKGIYAALNSAIMSMNFSYYIVSGVDDRIFLVSIFEILNKTNKFDILAFSAMIGDRITVPRGGSVSRFGQFCLISSHAIGTIYNKKLHDTFGMYDTGLKIAADQEFNIKLILAREKLKLLEYRSILSGRFGTYGVSSRRRVLSAFELSQVLFKHRVLNFRSIFLIVRCLL